MAKTDSPPAPAKAESLMYLGERRMAPIPLARGNVFSALPPVLQKALATDPALAACFVPLSQAGKILRDRKRSAT